MFHSIKLLNQEAIDDHKVRATFRINDTCFSHETIIISPSFFTNIRSLEPVAVLKAYSERQLDVVRNLAYYYLSIENGKTSLHMCREFIDKNYPALQYIKRYAQLIEIYYNEFSAAIIDYNGQFYSKLP